MQCWTYNRYFGPYSFNKQMDKMRKCRSIGGEEKAEWEVSFIQGHDIWMVWGQIQSSLSLTLYPNDTRKAACATLCTFTPSLSAFPEPSAFSLRHLLFMAPQPGPLWPLHPRGRRTLPCHLWSYRKSDGTEMGNPIYLCSFYFLPPTHTLLHLPTSETPTPP